MKTVIMAGGIGKRAADIDSSVPKPLIRVGDKPILQWEIEHLVAQGYKDIVLTVSHKADLIMEYFGSGVDFGCKIDYYKEEIPIGNAGALFKLWKVGELKDDFLLLNADSMFDVDIGRFERFHRDHNALASIITHPNDHPYDSGLIETDSDNKVVRWYTKEDERPRWYKNRVNAGIHIINCDLFKRSDIDPDSIGDERRVDLDRDVLKAAIDDGGIYAYDSPEYIKDMGSPERFERVVHDVVSGRIRKNNLSLPQKCVFLDRDGTINKYVPFLTDIDSFELAPGVSEAIRHLNRAGYLVIVVTNQPVVARGEITSDELNEIHCKMETLLGRQGAYIDALYYCPHHPDGGYDGEIKELKKDCCCRKPKPGMLLEAASKYNIDLSKSWMVGDGKHDIGAGIAAGCHTALIGEGEYGQEETVSSLLDFVKRVLSI